MDDLQHTSQLPQSFQLPLDGFLRALSANNRSDATVLAYSADVRQFLLFAMASNMTIQRLDDIERAEGDIQLENVSLREPNIAKSGFSGLACRVGQT